MTSSFKPSFYHTLQHPLSYISLRIRKASFFQNKPLSNLQILSKLFKSVDKQISSFSKKTWRKASFSKNAFRMAMKTEWVRGERERAFGGFLTYLSMRFNYLDCVSLQIFFKQESIGRWCGEMLFSCKRQPKSQVKSK